MASSLRQDHLVVDVRRWTMLLNTRVRGIRGKCPLEGYERKMQRVAPPPLWQTTDCAELMFHL